MQDTKQRLLQSRVLHRHPADPLLCYCQKKSRAAVTWVQGQKWAEVLLKIFSKSHLTLPDKVDAIQVER